MVCAALPHACRHCRRTRSTCCCVSRWPPPTLSRTGDCERTRGVGPVDEGWRRALEISILITICSCFFFAHYYYLIALVIPYSVLLVRYIANKQRAHLAAWALSYFLVSAFVVPISILTRLAGTDMWARYVVDGWFLYGELLLVWLLMAEYWRIGARVTLESRAAIS